MTFQECIIENRRKKDWSQRKVGLKAGISAAYYSTLEKGQFPPSAPIVREIAKVLGVDEYLLLMLAGYMPTEVRLRGEIRPTLIAGALHTLALVEQEKIESFVGEGYGRRTGAEPTGAGVSAAGPGEEGSTCNPGQRGTAG